MTTKERIFHSALFEAIALIFVIAATMALTNADATTSTGLAVALSLIAMCWNYLYNIGFDQLFGHNRIERNLKLRIVHGLGFELGLVFVTLPLMMWVLQLDFLTVFLMDIGVIIFFLVYSIIYNWCYDHIRERIITRKNIAIG